MAVPDDETVIILAGMPDHASLAKVFEMERLCRVERPEIIVLEPPRHERDLCILPAIGRERDHTAPRSPRQSFKKSSKR